MSLSVVFGKCLWIKMVWGWIVEILKDLDINDDSIKRSWKKKSVKLRDWNVKDIKNKWQHCKWHEM